MVYIIINHNANICYFNLINTLYNLQRKYQNFTWFCPNSLLTGLNKNLNARYDSRYFTQSSSLIIRVILKDICYDRLSLLFKYVKCKTLIIQGEAEIFQNGYITINCVMNYKNPSLSCMLIGRIETILNMCLKGCFFLKTLATDSTGDIGPLHVGGIMFV